MTNHLLVLHVPVNGFYEGLIHNFPKGYGETDLTAVPSSHLFWNFIRSAVSCCSFFSQSLRTFSICRAFQRLIVASKQH